MIEKIIGRLLQDGHVSVEEAMTLLSNGETSSEKITKLVTNLTSEFAKKVDALQQRIQTLELSSNPFQWPNTVKPNVPWDDPFKKTSPPRSPFEPYEKHLGMPQTYGDICSCNPKNGGSGVCGCVMGNNPITVSDGTGVSISTTGTGTTSTNTLNVQSGYNNAMYGYLNLHNNDDDLKDQAGRV